MNATLPLAKTHARPDLRLLKLGTVTTGTAPITMHKLAIKDHARDNLDADDSLPSAQWRMLSTTCVPKNINPPAARTHTGTVAEPIDRSEQE
jgi:hypothetical protein